jgi:hypothetical protein
MRKTGLGERPLVAGQHARREFSSHLIQSSVFFLIIIFSIYFQINNKDIIRMVRKARGHAAVLQTIPDNKDEEIMPTTSKDGQGVLDVIQLINNIESQSKLDRSQWM